MVNNTIVNNLANAIINKISSMISGKEDSSNKVSSWTSPPDLNNTKYAGEKLVKDTLDTKLNISQGSGYNGYYMKVNNSGNVAPENVNFKTINNESILGSGNLEIGESVGTFTDLQTLINNATAPSGQTPVIILDKDYKYDSTTDSSLSSGIEITQNIIIIGNGHIIDGNNYAKAFIDIVGYTWELNDLKIQNCTSDNDNKYGYNEGGAITTEDGAIVNINNTTFNKNTTNGDGGAIYAINGATININNTTFNKNTATNGGGAIFAEYGVTININNTTFNKNSTTEYNGGAIYCETTLTITNCIFNSNIAYSYDNIYSEYEITVYGCIIPNIATSCYNVTNVTIESLVNMIGDAITYINMGDAINYIVGSGE